MTSRGQGMIHLLVEDDPGSAREALGKAGITVARRTVTKYRKAMNIPSSRGRRDWTKAGK
jgi:hypothetical protein